MNFENKIKELNLVLPEARDPVALMLHQKLLERCFIYQVKSQLEKMVN